jgi:hypothetical protein
MIAPRFSTENANGWFNLRILVYSVAIFGFFILVAPGLSHAQQNDLSGGLAALLSGEPEQAKPAFELPDPYEIDRVEVDVTAGTAAIARQIAIRQGQRRALNILFQRLTIEEDRQRIPVLDDARVAALVLSIKFENERYSSTRYIADITITFSQPAVRELLDIAGSRFSETMARPILVLAQHENAGLSVHWDDNETWQRAWREADWRTSLVPFIVPGADGARAETDMSLILDTGDPENVAFLAQLYGTSETLTIIARDTIDLFSATPQLEVTTIRRDASSEESSDQRFVRQANETSRDFFDRVADTIGGAIADQWKEQTLVSLSDTGSLEAIVQLENLSAWVSLKADLQKISLIKDVTLKEISASRALLQLDYLGSPQQLSASLGQRSIMMQDMGRIWQLSVQ